MNSLDEHKVYRVQKERMLNNDELAKDVIAVGLQNLTAGDKNPLAEYNGAFRKLQKRRKMNPVTTEPSFPTTLPSSLQSVPPSPSGSPLPKIPLAVIANDEGSPVPEEKNEAEQILSDLEGGVLDNTLPRLTEDDVAYDMDEVVIEVDPDVESGDSDTSDEGGSDIEWGRKNE
jgi:hypothetical protein